METVSNWGPGYEISFEMFVHSYGVGNINGYSWLFVVANQNADSIGYGQPAIWLHKNGYLIIYSYASESEFDKHVKMPVPLKKWTKVNIKSHQDDKVRIIKKEAFKKKTKRICKFSSKFCRTLIYKDFQGLWDYSVRLSDPVRIGLWTLDCFGFGIRSRGTGLGTGA